MDGFRRARAAAVRRLSFRGEGLEFNEPRAAVSHVVPATDSPPRGDFDARAYLAKGRRALAAPALQSGREDNCDRTHQPGRREARRPGADGRHLLQRRTCVQTNAIALGLAAVIGAGAWISRLFRRSTPA